MNEPTSEPASDVDWWASRLVDQEIAFADVPADLRAGVRERADEFAAQRQALLRLGVEHRVDATITDRAVVAAMQPTDAVVVPLRRRLVPLMAVAAASVAVIAVGTSVLQRDSEPDVVALDLAANELSTPEPAVASDAVTPGAAAETSASSTDDTATMSAGAEEKAASEVRTSMPTDVVEIADMIELAEFTRDWWTSPPPLLDGPAACADDQGREAVAVNVRFAGIDAQAYFSAGAGVMLLATADCLKLASIVP